MTNGRRSPRIWVMILTLTVLTGALLSYGLVTEREQVGDSNPLIPALGPDIFGPLLNLGSVAALIVAIALVALGLVRQRRKDRSSHGNKDLSGD